MEDQRRNTGDPLKGESMMSVYAGEHYFRDPTFPFHMDRYVIGRNQHIPSHTHDFVEFVFVVSGCAVHEMSGHRYELKPGDVFVIEPDIYHSYTASAEVDTIVYNVLFDPRLLRVELESLLQLPAFVQFFYLRPFLRRNASFVPYQSLNPEEKQTIESHLHVMHDEYKTMRDGFQLLIRTRWIETMIWLSRYLEQPPPTEKLAIGDRKWIDSILHVIETHYNQPLTLEQLSRSSGMSVSSFTAKFREATGRSPMDYKQGVMISHACALLTGTGRKVLDIAHETGFNDISFFNKMFRKHTGMTPKQYRQERV